MCGRILNSYIVRIYSYEEGPQGKLAGLAGIGKSPEDVVRKPFATFDELALMINQMEKDVAGRKAKEQLRCRKHKRGQKNHNAKIKKT